MAPHVRSCGQKERHFPPRAAKPPVLCVLLLAALPLGCADTAGQGKGPGHRRQVLALSPEQEVALGTNAYREILSKSKVVKSGEDVARVRRVGESIRRAVEIESLQREMNLNLRGYNFAWEFNVVQDDHVNAFCLPGGKVAVFTGLFKLATTDDQLATVLSHEIAHALAHHASERIAREQMTRRAVQVAGGVIGAMDPHARDQLLGVLSAGARVNGLRYDRQQESEADHIGVFLMTFAGYDPREALKFWEKMEEYGRTQGRPPKILSDHPSDAERIRALSKEVPQAMNAKRAYEAGHRVAR